MLYGYMVIMAVGIIYQVKFKKLLGLLAICLEFVFTSLSMLTRNVKVEVTNNYFAALILIIDLYIMTLLYYLYSNFIRLKKEIK